MNTAEFLASYPVFSLETARAHLAGDARQRILHAVEKGRAALLRRGLYAGVQPGHKPGQVVPDRYLVMAAARPDAILAGHSALELHGLAHSEWTRCTAYSDQRRTKFKVRGIDYSVLAHPAPLRNHNLRHLGVATALRANMSVRYLGPERCLVDGFDRPRIFGGVIELVKSLDGLTMIDFELLEQLLNVFSKRKLFGAVGWFLDRQSNELCPPVSLLQRLREMTPRSPQYVERSSESTAANSQWSVVLPRELIAEAPRDD